MDWLPIDSKMLSSIAYDAGKHILHLRFRTGEVYRYFKFSAEDYQEFLNAESRGKHFLANIRDQFRYERMAVWRQLLFPLNDNYTSRPTTTRFNVTARPARANAVPLN